MGMGYKPALGCSKNRGESESTARFCGVGLDLDLELDEPPALVLDEPSTLECATKCDLVGILEIATNGEPGGEPRDPQIQMHHHARKVGGRRLPLEIRIGRNDHLGDNTVGEALHQLTDAQIIRSDSVNRADRAAEHVIEPPELAGALDCHDILRLLDHTNRGGRSPWVAADVAELLLGHVAADVAKTHLLLHRHEHLGKAGDIESLGLEDVERDALRRLRTYSGQSPQFVDQFLDYSVVHAYCSLGATRGATACSSMKLAPRISRTTDSP